MIEHKLNQNRILGSFHISVTDKILEWSPLNVNWFKTSTNLPSKIVSVPDDCTEAFEVVLDKLVEVES